MGRTLTEALQNDHHRLDAVLIECKTHAGSGRFAAAAERFAPFQVGLGRHIDAEEELLFPVLTGVAPQAKGPVTVMRAEHRKIRELMATLAEAFAASDPAWRATAGALEEVLAAHNVKEERVLYPMADDATSNMADVDAVRSKLDEMIG